MSSFRMSSQINCALGVCLRTFVLYVREVSESQSVAQTCSKEKCLDFARFRAMPMPPGPENISPTRRAPECRAGNSCTLWSAGSKTGARIVCVYCNISSRALVETETCSCSQAVVKRSYSSFKSRTFNSLLRINCSLSFGVARFAAQNRATG